MSEQESDGDALKTKRRVYRCKFCDLDYTVLNDWKRHILSIHNVMAYNCLQCSELFYNEENLTDHMKTIHKGKTRHFCKLCSRSYKNEKQLEVHIDYKHKIEDAAECETCGQEFHNTIAYKMHLQLHHKPHHVYYKCKKCHRSFRVPHYLKLHKQFDHNPDGKRMILEFLKMKNVDILTTDGVKCKSCKITFKSGVDLIRHMKQSHVKKVKKFACCKCKDAVYLSRASLGIHMRYEHGMLNHSCKLCPPVQKRTKPAPLKPKLVKAKNKNDTSKQKNKGNRSRTDGSLLSLFNVGKNLSNVKLNKNIAQSEAPWAGRFIKENLPSDLENIDEQQLQNLLCNIKTAFNIMCTVAPSRLKASATSHLSSTTKCNILVKDVNSINSDLHVSSLPVCSNFDVLFQDPNKSSSPLKSSDIPNISADIGSSDNDSRIEKSITDANVNNEKASNITLKSTHVIKDKHVKAKISTEKSTRHSVSRKVLCHPKKRKINVQVSVETLLDSDDMITDTEKGQEVLVEENTSCHPKKRKLNVELVEKEEKTVSIDHSGTESKIKKKKEDVRSDKTCNESSVSETNTNILSSDLKIKHTQVFRIPKITVKDFSKDMPKMNAVNKEARRIIIPKPAQENVSFLTNVTDEKENSLNKNISQIYSSPTDTDYTVEEIEAFLNSKPSSIKCNDESTLNVDALTPFKSQSTEVKSNIKINKTLKAFHRKTKLEDSANNTLKSLTKGSKSLKTSKARYSVNKTDRASSTPKINLSHKFKVKSYGDVNEKAPSKSNDNKTNTSLQESSFDQTILLQEISTGVTQKLKNDMLDKSNQKASTSKDSSSGSKESLRQKYKSSEKHKIYDDAKKDAKVKSVSSQENLTINDKASKLMSHILDKSNKKTSTSKVLFSENKVSSNQKQDSIEKQQTYEDSKKNKTKHVSSHPTINDKSVSKLMLHTLDKSNKKASVSKVSSSENKERSRQKHKSSVKHKRYDDSKKDENMKSVSSQENLPTVNDKSESKLLTHTLDKNNKRTSSSKVSSSGNKESSRHKHKSSEKQKTYDKLKKDKKMKSLSSEENHSTINDESVVTSMSPKKLESIDTNKTIVVGSSSAREKMLPSKLSKSDKSYSNERNKSGGHKGEKIKDKSSLQTKNLCENSDSSILKLSNNKQSSDDTNEENIMKSSMQKETLVANDVLKSNKKTQDKNNKHRSGDKKLEKWTSQEKNMSIVDDNVDSILELSSNKHYSNEKNEGTVNSQQSDKKLSSVATEKLSCTLKTSHKTDISKDNKNKNINEEIITKSPMQKETSLPNDVSKISCDKKKDIHNSPSLPTAISDANDVMLKSPNKKQNNEVVAIKLQDESMADAKPGPALGSEKQKSDDFEKEIILVTKPASVAKSPSEKLNTKVTSSSSQEEIPVVISKSTPVFKIHNKKPNVDNADIKITYKPSINQTPEKSDIHDSQNISLKTPEKQLQPEKFSSPEIIRTPISTSDDVTIQVLSPFKKVRTSLDSDTSILKSPEETVTHKQIINLPKNCKRTIFISKDMIMKANPFSSNVFSMKDIPLLGMKKVIVSPMKKLTPEASINNDDVIPMSADQAEQSLSYEIGSLKEAGNSEDVTVENQSEAILENPNKDDKTHHSSDEIIVDSMEVEACDTNTSDIKKGDDLKRSPVKPQKERSKPKSRKRVKSDDTTADENKIKPVLECAEQIQSMKDVKVLLHRVDQVLSYRKEVNKFCLMSTSDKEAKQEGQINANTREVSYEDGIPDDDYHLSVDDTFCLPDSQLADVQYDETGMNMIEVANYVDIVTSDSPTPSKTISPVTVTVTTTNKEYVCPFCHLKCEDQLVLLNHLTEIHGNDDENTKTLYKCRTCGSGFRLKDTLDRHVRGEHTMMTNFNCDHCNAVFFYKYHLKKHIKYDHANTANMCDICMEKFKTTTDLNNHSCGPLQQKNVVENELPVHISEKNVETSVNEPEIEKFSTNEQEEFVEVEKLSIYEPEITLKIDETPKKRVRFSNDENEPTVRKVPRKVKKSYKCDICNLNFQSGLLLFNHNRLLHKLTHIFKCAICSVQFLSQANLERHTCRTDIKLECKKCKLIFGSRDAWVEHKKEAHNMGTLKCDYCYKYFKTNQNLVKHTTLKHLEKSDFVNMAELPNKPQKKSHNLQARMTSNIYDDLKIINEASENKSSSISAKQAKKLSRTHMCNICKSMFKSEKDLLLHSKIHKLHRRLYTCLKCMRKFPQKMSLLKHIKCAHNVETNKIYRCRKCNAVFKFQDKLIQHNKLKHSSKRNAALHFIMKKRRLSSPNKSLMRLEDESAQIGTSTMKNKPVITSEFILTPQMLRGEMFRCKECSAYLPSEDSLQRHMQWEHLKMHKCGHCGLVLPTAEEFLRHLMSGHANEKIKEVLPTAQIGLVSENRLKWKTQLVHNYSRQGD